MYKAAKRWIYRGNRPDGIARFLNGILKVLHSSGLSSQWVTLEVVGRKSGRMISLPVVVAQVEGERYLVSMLGNEAQWVLNVRASEGKAFIISGKRRQVLLEEVPVEYRAPIIKAYLKVAPGARPHIPIDKDAPVTQFEPIAAAYPAYKITPID